jgi:hypothetical protein
MVPLPTPEGPQIIRGRGGGIVEIGFAVGGWTALEVRKDFRISGSFLTFSEVFVRFDS